jgi:hypothetical protein
MGFDKVLRKDRIISCSVTYNDQKKEITKANAEENVKKIF